LADAFAKNQVNCGSNRNYEADILCTIYFAGICICPGKTGRKG
jgi:hypothetical protein